MPAANDVLSGLLVLCGSDVHKYFTTFILAKTQPQFSILSVKPQSGLTYAVLRQATAPTIHSSVGGTQKQQPEQAPKT